MNTSLQHRASSMVGRLSAIAQDTNRRVRAAQQATLTQQTEREAKEQKLLKGRLSRARIGLRRILTFANSRPIRQMIKGNELLRIEQSLPFHKCDWYLIGNTPTSHVSFAISSQGVSIAMTNDCHVFETAIVFFPYKKGEQVTVQLEFGGRKEEAKELPLEDVLYRVATGDLGKCLMDENMKALEILGLWSRPAPFDRAAIAFLQETERTVENNLESEKRRA